MDTQSIGSVKADKTDSVSTGDFLPLTFTAVDGLAFAAMKARLGRSSSKIFIVTSLGPLVELLRLWSDGLLPRLNSNPRFDFSSVSEFYNAYQRRDRLWICPSTQRLGLLRTCEDDDQTATFRFCSAAQKAATAAGFPKSVARQLAAALGEMLDNIYLHSKMSVTGLAAFDAHAQRFEFVVADGGIGILRSLRECDEYSGLSDHGDALDVALRDGCSRYGTGTNHGHGFSPLFVGLSNLNGSLRFRSGDHALTIDGRDPKNIPWRKSAKPPISGFLASVIVEA